MRVVSHYLGHILFKDGWLHLDRLHEEQKQARKKSRAQCSFHYHNKQAGEMVAKACGVLIHYLGDSKNPTGPVGGPDLGHTVN